MASGPDENQAGFSGSDGAQEAQMKVCREEEMAIAGTRVPMAIWPRGVDVGMHPSGPPAVGGD